MTAEDKLYVVYLNAFAIVRSGGALLAPRPEEGYTLEEWTARAMAASDAQDENLGPAPKWVMLADVDRLLNSKEPEEAACKVVPIEVKP
jgi:hypothetical protein